jgi:sugar phosphate isomerase/epimerase
VDGLSSKRRKRLSRRDVLRLSIGLGAAGPLAGALASERARPRTRFGLVTYQWGKDWDLPTLIANCEKAKVLGVELRTTHAHGVEPNLSAQQRSEVKKRFSDSPVVLVGLGSNERFDDPDPAKLKKAIEATKSFVRLSHDVGGSGVKVKPDSFHAGVSPEKTIEQIGESLDVLGAFAAEYGQQIRLEVHGDCSRLPIMKKVLEVADNPNVAVCWNCNPQDLEGKGLEYNFNLVKERFGATAHVREMNVGTYPYQALMNLFVKMGYKGWILLEAHSELKGGVEAIVEQRDLWKRMIAKAQEDSRN